MLAKNEARVEMPADAAASAGGGVLIYAGFWARVAALLVDSAILMIVGVVLFVVLGMAMGAAGVMIGNILFFFLQLLYWPVMESSARQATFGKGLLGIQVTDGEGNRTSFIKALLRNLAKIISSIPFGIGFLLPAFTARKQALHDIITNCLVVSTGPSSFLKAAVAAVGGLAIAIGASYYYVFHVFLPQQMEQAMQGAAKGAPQMRAEPARPLNARTRTPAAKQAATPPPAPRPASQATAVKPSAPKPAPQVAAAKPPAPAPAPAPKVAAVAPSAAAPAPAPKVAAVAPPSATPAPKAAALAPALPAAAAAKPAPVQMAAAPMTAQAAPVKAAAAPMKKAEPAAQPAPAAAPPAEAKPMAARRVAARTPTEPAAPAGPAAKAPKYNDVMTAVMNGDRAGAAEALGMGIWADRPDSNGVTPLMVAAQNGDAAMTDLLLKHGADPNRGSAGGSVLAHAMKGGNSTVIALLKKAGAR